MLRFFRLVVCLLCVLLPSSLLAREGFFANGSPYDGRQDKDLPRTIFLIDFAGGAGLVPQEVQGLSWILTEILAEGPLGMSADEYRRQNFLNNADIGFGTDSRYLRLFVIAPNESFSESLQVLKSVVEKPKLDMQTFTEKKIEVQNERLAMNNSPQAVLGYYAFRDLFDYHPLQLDGTGSPWSIGNIKLPMLKEYFPKLLNWNHATVAFIGPMKVEDVLSKVNSVFFADKNKQSRYSEFRHPMMKPVGEKATTTKATVIHKAGSTDHQVLQLHRYHQPLKPDSTDYLSTRVLHRLLGHGLTGRLSAELRGKQGLTYHISSFGGAITPLWGVSTFADSHKLQALLEGVPKVIDNFKREKIQKSEVRREIESMENSYLASVELQKDRLFDRVADRHKGYSRNFTENYLRYLKKVNAKSVAKSREKYLFSDHGEYYFYGDKDIIVPVIHQVYGIDAKDVKVVGINDIR